ncbi:MULTISPECIES: hypothetical protein [unclassified Fusobacterium]|uniref:hypothetical protein n=1 Tax=unclassified Fusobacterium TaxID=2648384 RepID=UPI001B8B3F3F|nr:MULTISPECIES: hypothetical protein [unclassified Fusobacterium]
MKTKVIFDTPFKNKLLFVTITDDGNAGEIPVVSGIDGNTLSCNGFTAIHGVNIRTFRYLAIGY